MYLFDLCPTFLLNKRKPKVVMNLQTYLQSLLCKSSTYNKFRITSVKEFSEDRMLKRTLKFLSSDVYVQD